MSELDFTKTIDFKVLGDIKPTIIKHLGFYITEKTSDYTVYLVGAHAIELPGFWRYLTYWGRFDKKGDTIAKRIISDLYEQGLIKICEEARKVSYG